MKKIIFIFFVLATFFSCKAQTPIIPLTTNEYGDVENAYYKDLGGDLENLVGTWLYVNGNEMFKIIIEKKEEELINLDIVSNISYYEDILYGEYRYVDETGTELVNSLTNINDPNLETTDHLIWGNDILTSPFNPPKCETCLPNERRVQLFFEDPQRSYLGGEATLRIIPDPFDQYTDERMELVLNGEPGIKIVPQGQPLENRIPYKTYILIKQ
ncbi:MAG TPA: DUF6705 family protein [Flavobacteriaceae bacterium]|nr:DUF6705 family protein [Flavobacteriaceae bacterium]